MTGDQVLDEIAAADPRYGIDPEPRAGHRANRATARQLTKLVLQLQDLGVRARPRRLACVAALAGLDELATMKDLTLERASLLIDELDHILAGPDPIAELAAAVARASELSRRASTSPGDRPTAMRARIDGREQGSLPVCHDRPAHAATHNRERTAP